MSPTTLKVGGTEIRRNELIREQASRPHARRLP